MNQFQLPNHSQTRSTTPSSRLVVDCKVKIYYHMDASFVHSDACLIKKPERDYGAEFDALKAENEKFLRL